MTELEKYFKALQAHRVDEITEHSHRSNLQQLLESLSGPKIKVLHEPKREGKFGSPDFKITHTESIIGYVENKKIEENLDKILKSDQIKKYQALSDNILLTNYIDWIWIKEGRIQQRTSLQAKACLPGVAQKLYKAQIKERSAIVPLFISTGLQFIQHIHHTLPLQNKIANTIIADTFFQVVAKQQLAVLNIGFKIVETDVLILF